MRTNEMSGYGSYMLRFVREYGLQENVHFPIASYVGGVPDMVTGGVSGLLYRFEEVEMLAESIRRVFTDDRLALRLSADGIEAAGKRHDRKANLEKTLQIYREINVDSE